MLAQSLAGVEGKRRDCAGGFLDDLAADNRAVLVARQGQDFDGAVAACGNVGGMDLPASVAPFILRGVSLLGVESVRPRIALRRAAWARIAADLDMAMIDAMCEIIPFDQALGRARSIVTGKIRGRVVIEMP